MLGNRSASARHTSGVVSQDYWQFTPGQRVMTREGIAGTVTEVSDGPFPGAEAYVVTLDDGMGGGEYGPSEIAALDTTTAAVEVAFTDRGKDGRRDHITMEERGTLPTHLLANMGGVMGEKPGEHRNKHGQEWEDFKSDIQAHGIKNPIFVTVDWNDDPKISEGNHRRDAAVELGMPEVPVQIRYFGNAHKQGTVEERMKRMAAYLVEDEVRAIGRQALEDDPDFLVNADGTGPRTAAEDYPELGSILEERPPLAHAVVGSKQADCGDPGPGDPSATCDGCGETVWQVDGGGWHAADGSLGCNGADGHQVTASGGCSACAGSGEQGNGHECYICDGSGTAAAEAEGRALGITNANPENGLPTGIDLAAGLSPAVAGWFMDKVLYPAAERANERLDPGHQAQPGSSWSYDWCRFRDHRRCMYPTHMDAEATAQRGYAVWVPQDRGLCPRDRWDDQKACPVGEPGEHSGDPAGRPLVAALNVTAGTYELAGSWPGEALDDQGVTCPYCRGEGEGGRMPVPRAGNVCGKCGGQGFLDARQMLGSVRPPFEFTAAWSDVRAKAKRIRSEGGVRIVATPGDIHNVVSAEVRGDHGIYQTLILRQPGRQAVASWECGCDWSSYSWGRSGRWKKYEGRMCSHALALVFEAQAQGMFGREIKPQTQTPPWRMDTSIPVRQPTNYPKPRKKGALVHPVSTDASLQPPPILEWAKAALEQGIEPNQVLSGLTRLGVKDAPGLMVVALRGGPIKAKVRGWVKKIIDVLDGGVVVLEDGSQVPATEVFYPTYDPHLGLDLADSTPHVSALSPIDTEANRLLGDAKRWEQKATDVLQRVARETGGKLAGYEYHLKELDSLVRKINMDAAEKHVTPVAAAHSIGDALRFTLELPGDHRYVIGVGTALDRLEDAGFAVKKLKNYWLTGDPYQGINSNITAPDGFTWELQFHTPDSFAVKMNTHEDFGVAAGRPGTKGFNTPGARVSAWKAMTAMAGGIPVPPRVLDFMPETLTYQPMPRAAALASYRYYLIDAEADVRTLVYRMYEGDDDVRWERWDGSDWVMDNNLARFHLYGHTDHEEVTEADAQRVIAAEWTDGHTSMSTEARGGLDKGQKCKFCDADATKALVWAEGMAYIPACDEHEDKARHVIEDENNDEVIKTTPLPPRESAHKLAEADSNGVMVAVRPPQDVCEALAALGDEDVDNMHITLSYLGGIDAVPFSEQELLECVAGFAANATTLVASVAGFGQFTAGPEPVAVTLIDCPGLSEFRAALVEHLRACGLHWNESHGFTPHLTLEYGANGVPDEVPDGATGHFTFGEVIVAWGGTWHHLPLAGLGFVTTDDAMQLAASLQATAAYIWPNGQPVTYEDRQRLAVENGIATHDEAYGTAGLSSRFDHALNDLLYGMWARHEVSIDSRVQESTVAPRPSTGWDQETYDYITRDQKAAGKKPSKHVHYVRDPHGHLYPYDRAWADPSQWGAIRSGEALSEAYLMGGGEKNTQGSPETAASYTAVRDQDTLAYGYDDATEFTEDHPALAAAMDEFAFEGELHEEPEPALPETDGAEDDDLEVTAADEGRVSVEQYGMHYDPTHATRPDVQAAKQWSGWDSLPLQSWSGSLNALEADLSRKSITKVVSGQEPFREGYRPRIFVASDGQAFVIDGHHRVAMHHALGQTPFQAHVLTADMISGSDATAGLDHKESSTFSRLSAGIGTYDGIQAGEASDAVTTTDLRPAWLSPGAAPAGVPAPGNAEIAQAAQAFLKQGMKAFSPAEQAAIIGEGEGTTAANLDRLNLAGTHYEALEAALAAADDDPEELFI